MNKEEIIDKLKELGITSTNCHPKSSFIDNGVVVIACFSSELLEDFYFFNNFDKKIYLLGKQVSSVEFEVQEFMGKKKYIVPLSLCTVIWEDVPFEEKADVPFKDMTLRQYACIQLQVADSGLPWLDVLIKKCKNET